MAARDAILSLQTAMNAEVLGQPRVIERMVIGLLAEGLTNNQLAQRLYISPKTAAVHVSNILTKLHLSTRAEAAAWAVRNGIADQQAS